MDDVTGTADHPIGTGTPSAAVPTARVRPVTIPEDIDEATIPKASGRVRLPLRVHWSGPSPEAREFDLDDPVERAYVYEIVMREGTADDVRRFIDVDELVALWDQLYLPDNVRRTWAAWLNEHRNLSLAC